jgi:D-alanyl-D-alanine carboxypeptidase (penicillin-binding protein 5/6)
MLSSFLSLKKTFLFFFTLSNLYLWSNALQVTTASQSVILINAQNGKILYKKNAYKKLYPASTTKIATCLMALHKAQSLDEVITCPLDCLIKIPKKLKIEHKYQDPAYRLEPDGTSYGIYPGEKLTVRDLLYGMMLSSGNDASNVLAHHFSNGNIEKFMVEMNKYLESIGCLNTKFFNPHGLHYPNHMTTARDLAILAKEALRNPEFVNIVSTLSYQRPKTNKQQARLVNTTNRLLKEGTYKFDKCFGIKTGYHELAGYNFVGAAKDRDRILISVVMKAPSANEAFKDTLRLYEEAFSEKMLTRLLINHQESVFTKKVKSSKVDLQAGLKDDLYVQYYPSEEEAFYPDIQWLDVKLPVKRGDKVGEVFVKLSNKLVIKKQDLIALNSLELPLWQKFTRAILVHKSQILCISSGFLFLVALGFLYGKRKKTICIDAEIKE